MSTVEQIYERIDAAIRDLEAIRRLVSSDFGERGFPGEAQQLVNNRICLQCKQAIDAKERVIRGCHDKCYKKVMARIREGAVTKDEAVAGGHIAPPNVKGRPKKELAIDRLVEEKEMERLNAGEPERLEVKAFREAEKKLKRSKNK